MNEQADTHDDTDDSGLSLDELSQAFAIAMAKGTTPYDSGENDPRQDTLESETSDESNTNLVSDDDVEDDIEPVDETDRIPTNPATILEAILFVGTPNHEPIKATQIAAMMRGVREDELDALVAELNEDYEKNRAAYRIVAESGGFRMVLHNEFESIRNNIYGEIKEAKLNQAAIDTLSIVAYRQPIEKEEIEKIRGKSSGSVLSQLVRRALLQVEFGEGKPRKKMYSTTDRFLKVFGLANLEELPQQLEFDD